MTRQDVFAYILYFAVSVILLQTQVYVQLSPVQYLIEPVFSPFFYLYESTRDSMNEFNAYLADRNTLTDRIEDLQSRNRKLKEQLYRGNAATRENKVLRKYLKLPPFGNYDLIPAEIIQRSLSGWERTIRINQGMSAGIKSDQLTISYRNGTWFVSGKVISTHDQYSTVVLNSDPRFRIGVTIEGINNRQFVARGWGNKGLRIEHFPSFLSVPVGSKVYTSRKSSLAPEPIYVGKVKKSVSGESVSETGKRLLIQPRSFSGRNSLVWVFEVDW